jgi:HNH endonuclease
VHAEPEQWAPIQEAPLYEVSTWGRVRRGPYDVATWENHKGYVCVSIEVTGRAVPVVRSVHRLALIAFKGPAPAGFEGNHGDGDKTNNAITNLEWTTPAGNREHARRLGLVPARRARRREHCRFGHPLDQTYRQRDRSGMVRSWKRCSRCRRVQYRRARQSGCGSLLELLAADAPS